MTIDLGYAVKLLPHRAVEYFRSKGYRISWDWNEVLGDAHNKAFTVAKATKPDVLRTIREGLDEAIANGLTEQQFIKSLEPRLRRLGWWGKKEVNLPGGGKQVVQLGSKHRLKTIYRTNMASAYNAGRYKQMKENAADRLYWQYVAVIDSRTRHAHRELHGKVFRYDDPFWDTFYPPNGWNCRCRVIALTADEVADEGLKVENGKAGLSKFNQTIINKGTGEVIKIDAIRYRGKDIAGKPFTIAPDASFGYNPGKGWAKWDTRGNIPDIGTIKPPDQKSLADYGLASIKDIPRSSLAPLPALPGIADQLKELEAKTVKPLLIKTPVEPVILDRRFVDHIAGKPPKDKAGRAPALIVDVVTDPDEVWLSPHSGGSWRRRFIKFYGRGEKKRVFVAIARDNTDGSLAWTSILTDDYRHADRQRYGTLLHQKQRGGS